MAVYVEKSEGTQTVALPTIDRRAADTVRSLKPLTTPQGLDHMPLEYYAPHDLKDGYKRNRDWERALDDLADKRRLHDAIKPDYLYNTLRIGLLAKAAYITLESIANHYGYTVPVFVQMINSAV